MSRIMLPLRCLNKSCESRFKETAHKKCPVCGKPTIPSSNYIIEYSYNSKRYRRSLNVDTLSVAKGVQREYDKMIKSGENPDIRFRPKKNKPGRPEMLSQLIDEFIKNLSVSNSTHKSLNIHLKTVLLNNPESKVEGIIKHDMEIKKITPEFVRDNIIPHLKARFKPNSAHTYATYFKWLFSYAVKWKYIEKNPFEGQIPKKEDIDYYIYSDQEIDSMREYAQGTLYDYVFLILNTGLRKSEAYNLRWNQVDLINRQLTFKGKGGKTRVVPLSDAALKILSNRSNSKVMGIRVFYNLLHPDTIYRPFKKIKNDLGIGGGSLHDLRHTFATTYIRKGGNVVILKEILGHSDIKTTMIYVNLAGQDLHQNINALTVGA